MTVEIIERKMKRKHDLFRKYPVIGSLTEQEPIVRSWADAWSQGNKSIESGLVDLVMYLVNQKSKVFEQLENCMQNNPNINKL